MRPFPGTHLVLRSFTLSATCLLFLAFHQPLWSAGACSRPAEREACFALEESEVPEPPQWKQAAPQSTKGPALSVAAMRTFFDEYLRLHAAKDMDRWVKLFLPEATIVRTADDGRVIIYKPAELARSIADEAAKLASQHETFEDIAIDVEGNAASYAGTWRLFHNGKEMRDGRAWYTLVRREGKWLIASLVWYRRAGSGVR